ncbi:MAG: hypothetical protein IKI88_01695 [Anaerotignum sp.]|nr:hypothetical protein [Anaerotignum sp.]
MTEKILTELKKLYQTEREEVPKALEFAAGRSVSIMKAYCGIDTLPEALLGVGVSLAKWIYDSGMGTEGNGRNAKSIKEGDVAVTFSTSAFEMQAKEKEMLAYFSVELDRFRKMDW